MRKMKFAVVSFLIAFSALLLPSCSKKAGEAEWKAEIETVDGVKTIRNPATPRYGEFAFNLVQDLVIGEEKDENRFFPRLIRFSVNDDGEMYISDVGNKRIQVFDRAGAFIRTLGRVGQGPGEYSYPGEIFFDEAGRPFVSSGRGLIVYEKDGTYLKNIPVKAPLNWMMIGPGGKVIGRIQPDPRADGGPKDEIVQLGSDGERSRTIAVYPVFGRGKDTLLEHWYTGMVCFCLRSRDSFYYGFSLDETIHVVDAEDRPLFAFSKTEERLPISAEEGALTKKDGIFAWYTAGDPHEADLGMPDHRPFYSRFFSDKAGRLYVVRFKPITEKDDPICKVDVFSKDGYYLYQMTWNFIPDVINDGYLYKVQEDENAGLYKVIRYKVANWADFKDK